MQLLVASSLFFSYIVTHKTSKIAQSGVSLISVCMELEKIKTWIGAGSVDDNALNRNLSLLHSHMAPDRLPGLCVAWRHT